MATFSSSSDDDYNGSKSYELVNHDPESVISDLESRFIIGKDIPGIEEAYLMYAEYGSATGFGVRMGRQLYFKGTKDVRRKEFYCSCRGFFSNKKDPVEVTRTYSRQHKRTGCGALLRIKLAFGKTWVVSKFVKNHNHELLSPDNTYLLRSVRNVSCHKKTVLNALRSAGIGVARSYRFLEYQSGGLQHVGFTKIDAFNYADSMKEFTRVKNGDARSLMKFCIDKSNSEASFYYDVKLDLEGRLMNIFYRDSRCLTDYEAFGNVLLIDTTYRTNKYDIVVAPFVGVNHHKQNILFGIGFLSSETTFDFKWLFSTFLDSMNGIQPKIIFTDQCQAMMSAIDIVFPSISHRLCHWHISRNATSHFGVLNRNKDFLRMWRRCMKGVESEDEFEQLWGHMRNKFALDEVPWFGIMYNLKRRWASVFTQHLFSCGIIATSRSEATNRSLKKDCASTNCLFEFVQCYEKMKTEWRNREVASDVSNIGNPGRCATANPILLAASRTLTRAVYMLFERQMINVLNYEIVSESLTEGSCLIKVQFMHDESDDEMCVDSGEDSGEASDEEKSNNHVDDPIHEDNWQHTFGDNKADEDMLFPRRIRTVCFDPLTKLATCSCKMWETFGILCRHILKVYNAKQVKVLPDCYLLPRWCKDAKLRLLDAQQRSTGETKCDGLDRLAYVNCFMRLAKEVSDDCQYVHACRISSLKKMKELRMSMSLLMDRHRRSQLNGQRHEFDRKSSHGDEFGDPPPSRRRGKMKQSKKSLKSHWESNQKGKKKKKHGEESKDKAVQASLKTGATPGTTTQSNKSILDHSPSSNSAPHTQFTPLEHDDNRGIFSTQQSSVKHSNERFVGIADVWHFEDPRLPL